jgi:hypothetical protein
MRAGLRIATGADLSTGKVDAMPRQLKRAYTAACELLDLGAPVERSAWIGVRPCHAGHDASGGRCPHHRGLWFNFGHGHQGFTLGPTTGHLLAGVMAGEPDADAVPLAPSRLAGCWARRMSRADGLRRSPLDDLASPPYGSRNPLCRLSALLRGSDGHCHRNSFIAQDFGLSPLGMGGVLSAFFIGYALMQVPGGMLADRFGPRRVMTASIVGWSIFTFITGTASGLAVLLMIRVLFGLSEGSFPPSASKAITLWFPPNEVGRANGFHCRR